MTLQEQIDELKAKIVKTKHDGEVSKRVYGVNMLQKDLIFYESVLEQLYRLQGLEK